MLFRLLSLIGRTFLHKSVGGPAQTAVSSISGGRLDLKLGWRLFHDRRVPVTAKLAAIALGATAAGVLQVTQFPVEAIVAILSPLFAIAELGFDGAEIVVAAGLAACAALPFLLPRQLFEELQKQPEDHTKDQHGRVYDAVGARMR